MIHTDQLRQYIIRPVLNRMDAYSKAAENLLVLTAAAESQGGYYLHQLGNGPALGIYQCEPATHNWLVHDWLAAPRRDALRAVVRCMQMTWPDAATRDADQMAGNLYYATAVCRLRYLAVPEPLPREHDDRALAGYWKQHYNTHLGAGDIDEAVAAYRAHGKRVA